MYGLPILLFISTFLFIRECKLDRKRYLEQDRRGDEHILREIEKFQREKGIR
jgi:hypothetical protein